MKVGGWLEIPWSARGEGINRMIVCVIFVMEKMKCSLWARLITQKITSFGPYYWDYPKQRDTISILGWTAGKRDTLMSGFDRPGVEFIILHLQMRSVKICHGHWTNTHVYLTNMSLWTFAKTQEMADGISQDGIADRTREIKLTLTIFLLFLTPEEGWKKGRWCTQKNKKEKPCCLLNIDETELRLKFRI